MPKQNDLPSPVTYSQKFYAKAAGMDVDLPEAITPEQKYLQAIAERGESIGNIGDVEIDNPKNGEVMKYDAEQEKWVNGTASGGGGTSDYTDLTNKPKINGVTLAGNKSLDDIGAADASEVDTLLSGKVDKVTGKGLSTNDFTNAYKTELDGLDTALDGKVDKVSGKGLSTNDFTDAYKNAVDGAAPQSTTYTKDEVDTALSGKQAALTTVQQAAVDSGVTAAKVKEYDELSEIVRGGSVLYGYRVNKNDSNPETRVEYLYDAIGMTPARMNYTTGTFDYGSWGNAWFITGNKPVALKYDGTIDYELDPDDYTKKADGTASDVSDGSYAGNFMASMPTVYIKRWSDGRYDYYAFSNKQITPDFCADAHDAGDGTINPYIYLPMFKGAIVDGKMRSIAGVTPQGNTSGSEEKTASEACGSGWQLWDWSKHELISDLLVLISRSTNSQAAFGQGDTNTYNASDTTTYGKLATGTSGVGQFWGAYDEAHHVKVFHIEDFWGSRWERCLGLNLVDNQYVYKLVRPYALDTDNTYTSSGLYAPAEGWQKAQNIGRFGTLPATVGGSNSTYECDYIYKSASGVCLGLFGGACDNSTFCGSRFMYLRNASSNRAWGFGGSTCFNPIPNE